MSKIFNGNKGPSLIGEWFSDLTDAKTVEAVGYVKMTFTKNGKLIYETIGEESSQVMNLTYQVDEDFIISDQRSSPRKEKTRFSFINENVLALWYDGVQTLFNRGNDFGN